MLDRRRGREAANGTVDGIEVGQTSAATLVLKNGTGMTSGTLAIGAATGTGTVDIESASGAALDAVKVTAFDATSSIEVGQTGASTLLLKNGTSIKDATIVLGVAGGSIGTVDVESASGAVFDDVVVTANGNLDSIEVGQTGTSILLLKSGTSISGGTLALGASGGKGTVDIESASGAVFDDVAVTAFDATSRIEVGRAGASTLLLKDGTSVKGATLAIGVTGGSTGTVDVESPSGAVLDDVVVTANGTFDSLEVGQTSAATLVLKNGTGMTGGTLAIGAAGGKGTVDIESATGAVLDNVQVRAFDATNRIEVGQSGTSTLLLKDGTSIKRCDADPGRQRRQCGHGRRRECLRRGA